MSFYYHKPKNQFAYRIEFVYQRIIQWRRLKDNKEAEPEADPERDQRMFLLTRVILSICYLQMPLKATEYDVYEFFSKVGKRVSEKFKANRGKKKMVQVMGKKSYAIVNKKV
ncbi:RNA-binding protein 39 [Artemisia annua]|uniref:RNA-binding protein 39 n=1 Tax=Artemisia annua TaxID=35608 RepID=A0A2U1NS88_ARTAN|nr:RNA-binding protein 39 [Artemisia annua]